MREFGGPSGIRNQSALKSALGGPRNKWAYEDAGLPELAAAYAFGIARNHPFVDGNKRVSLLAPIIFLELNGVDFTADEAEAASITWPSPRARSEEGLARWIKDNWPKA